MADAARSEKIRSLKLLIGQIPPSGREVLSAPGLPQGLPRGLIVELTGTAATEWLCQFLKTHSTLAVFWCEKKQQILPTALAQRGVGLEQVTFAVFAEQSVPSLRRVIQSQLYPVVIAPSDFNDLNVLKAFQLFTEQANSLLFLLGDKKPRPFWPIAVQLEIHRREAHFSVTVLRDKSGSLG
jgi:hypothetical protein